MEPQFGCSLAVLQLYLPRNGARRPQVAERLHAVIRQLRERREERPTLEVEDEYDVQDLFHALLIIYFDDIRKEEWSPSYAGGASRMDFLLPEVELCGILGDEAIRRRGFPALG
ncbi:hypothetical protein GCM10007858_48480 [Bradyrhizobium liaoningense]|uniref:PD-(D/E)XK nuclease domain-containing protein n=1 Tax=Bradyrhizobium liaoningense TaxID=43992 RepID=UPI00235DAFAF|nr:hypothetical protein [Bradyrhizobium liaoningense]GLR97208.1 hypothetical protein GCM10007858_48480 [Bradyrhizobium liaoningense]